MSHLYRKDSGHPIRKAMKAARMSAPRVAEATRHVDPNGKGVSEVTVHQIAGSGETARDRCRLRTAWWIAEALDAPLQDLFSMTPPVTVTEERSTPHADEDEA
ncbi:MAG TPA: XRE family transcriptional regulator [Streptomyces sp.]|nr:XRE family transcriptional regulator [Streptomyces sp.]